MEFHGLLDTCINNGLHHLPEDLQDLYPLVICVTLGYEYQVFPYKICKDGSVLPHELDKLHNFNPFCWFGWGCCLIFQIRLPQPRLEVLGLQVCVAP